MRPRRLLMVGLACLGLHAALAGIAGAPPDPAGLSILTLALSVFYLATARGILAAGGDPATENLTPILVLAFLFRLVAVLAPPSPEKDIHRYLWDGKVWSRGINPYFYPPDSLFLEELRDANWEEVEYKNIPTLYPPAAQVIFLTCHTIAPGNPLAMRATFMIFDIGVILLLLLLLRRMNLPRSRILLYAWNPMVVRETEHAGHLDVACLIFVLLFLHAVLEDRRKLAGAALGLAILTKSYPVVYLLFLAPALGAGSVALACLVVLAGYATFLPAGELLLEGLQTFSLHWEFNGSLFYLLKFSLSLVLEDADRAARLSAPVLMMVAGSLLWWRRPGSPSDISRGLLYLTGWVLMLSPIVQPWYLMWIVPLTCLCPQGAWIYLSVASGLGYAGHHLPQVRGWLLALEYLPFYAMLLIAWRHGRKSQPCKE